MIEVRKLPVDRWEDYRDLRLEALKNDPAAFSSSYEEENSLTTDEWKRRIQNVLFALSEDRTIGMIVYVFSDRTKTKHIANIFGVYVNLNHRGRGIGRKLLDEALLHIQKNKEIRKVKLTVNPYQHAAVMLYQKAGFVIAGKMKKELGIGRKCYDELIMEKLL